MLSFQNKCKQNDVQLRKMTKTRERSESLTTSDVVKEEPNDVAESENSLDGSLDEETWNANECTNSVVDQDESSEVDTKEILEVNVDDLESDAEDVTVTKNGNSVRREIPINQYADFHKPHNPKPPMIACEICGKLYGKYKLQHHMNKHNGKNLIGRGTIKLAK